MFAAVTKQDQSQVFLKTDIDASQCLDERPAIARVKLGEDRLATDVFEQASGLVQSLPDDVGCDAMRDVHPWPGVGTAGVCRRSYLLGWRVLTLNDGWSDDEEESDRGRKRRTGAHEATS
jgi:hypothetical protein